MIFPNLFMTTPLHSVDNNKHTKNNPSPYCYSLFNYHIAWLSQQKHNWFSHHTLSSPSVSHNFSPWYLFCNLVREIHTVIKKKRKGKSRIGETITLNVDFIHQRVRAFNRLVTEPRRSCPSVYRDPLSGVLFRSLSARLGARISGGCRRCLHAVTSRWRSK